MNRHHQAIVASVLLTLGGAAHGAGPDLGATAKQATNWTAIVIFGVFVLGTLWITKWAAGRTRSASDFYTAGVWVTPAELADYPMSTPQGKLRSEWMKEIRQGRLW